MPPVKKKPALKKKAPAKKTTAIPKAKPDKPATTPLPGFSGLDTGKGVTAPAPIGEEDLSIPQDRFCREYIIAGNGVRSYQTAYPNSSYEAAKVSASELLTKANIQARVKELADERNAALNLDAPMVLKRLSALVNFDPRKLYDESGTLKNIPDMDHDVALCVQSIEVDEIMGGRGEDRKVVGYTKKVKFVDAKTVIELIGKNLSLWKDVGSKENPLNAVVTKIERVIVKPA